MTAVTGDLVDDADGRRYVFGLIAAIVSSVFIGSSLVLQKKALGRLGSTSKSLKIRKSLLNCIFDGLWLTGVLLMAVGECFNFVAYAFAPASLVAPLGALSVVTATVLSSRFLNESLNLLSFCGCVACILGAVVVVIHSPKNTLHLNIEDLIVCSRSAGFIWFCLLTLLLIIVLISVAPRYGSRNILIYIAVCSLIGVYTVPSAKGLAIALEDGFYKNSTGSVVVAVVCILTLVVCCSAQLFYLNKALSLFNASIVTPIYYAFFTTAVVTSTGIFFRELISMQLVDCVGGLCGFLIILLGTFLMQVFKDANVTMDHVRMMVVAADDNSEQNDRLL